MGVKSRAHGTKRYSRMNGRREKDQCLLRETQREETRQIDIQKKGEERRGE